MERDKVNKRIGFAFLISILQHTSNIDFVDFVNTVI